MSDRTFGRRSCGFKRAFALMLCVLALGASASAQTRRPTGAAAARLGEKLVDIKLSEMTLEAINFRDQTARINIGLDISNGFLPVSLKDFDYRISLYDEQAIEGHYDGTMKIGGRRPSRINLPIVINLRSIPGVVLVSLQQPRSGSLRIGDRVHRSAVHHGQAIRSTFCRRSTTADTGRCRIDSQSQSHGGCAIRKPRTRRMGVLDRWNAAGTLPRMCRAE